MQATKTDTISHAPPVGRLFPRLTGCRAFLRTDPAAPLTVAVGFASVRGLAWLAERAVDRPVTLVIGDCRQRNFARARSKDRTIAAAFLARDDVEVRNWYRKTPQPAEAHLKVWIAHTERGPAALVGSANLTGAGLYRNREMVVEPIPSDLPRVAAEVEELVDQAYDAKTRLMGHVSGNEKAERSEKGRRPDKPPSSAEAPKGCLRTLLELVGYTALLAAALAFLRLTAAG